MRTWLFYCNVHNHVCTWLYIHIFIYMYSCIYTYIYTYVNSNISKFFMYIYRWNRRMYICIHMFICVYIYLYMYIHIHIHIHENFNIYTCTWHRRVRSVLYAVCCSAFRCECVYIYVNIHVHTRKFECTYTGEIVIWAKENQRVRQRSGRKNRMRVEILKRQLATELIEWNKCWAGFSEFLPGLCLVWCWNKTLQHTTKKCNIPQHVAAHCSTLQHTATHCNALQRTAAYCNTLAWFLLGVVCWVGNNTLQYTAIHFNTQQHPATHCNTLQHTAAHYNTLAWPLHVVVWCVWSMKSLKRQLATKFTSQDNWRADFWECVLGLLGVPWCVRNTLLHVALVLPVAMCCSVLQCVAVWCTVLQCVCRKHSTARCAGIACCSVMHCDALCCSVCCKHSNSRRSGTISQKPVRFWIDYIKRLLSCYL